MTRVLFLDTETTGLSAAKGDELVELALLDADGKPLIDTLLRPTKRTSWPEAQRIHGITPAMVQSAPTLDELAPALFEHMKGARVIVYNAAFDWQFMPARVKQAPLSVECAMLRFAEFFGDWNEYHGNYRWQKLDTAARHVFHIWEGAAHRARADAHACRSVWLFLETPDEERDALLERARAVLVAHEEREAAKQRELERIVADKRAAYHAEYSPLFEAWLARNPRARELREAKTAHLRRIDAESAELDAEWNELFYTFLADNRRALKLFSWLAADDEIPF